MRLTSLLALPRIYHQSPLTAESTVELTQLASQHAVAVRRMRVGDALILFNGDGFDYLGEIHAIRAGRHHRVIVHILKSYSGCAPSPLSIHLYQAMSRLQRMDVVMQKATELGVRRITPIWTARTTVQLSGQRLIKKQEHWQQIVISACEQCGRSELPQLDAPLTLQAALSTLSPGGAVERFTEGCPEGPAEKMSGVLAEGVTERFSEESEEMEDATKASSAIRQHAGIIQQTLAIRLVCHLNAETGLSALQTTFPNKINAVSLLIGPEGGLTDEEVNLAKSLEFRDFSLGPRILRTETAPLVALSLLQSHWGDLG